MVSSPKAKHDIFIRKLIETGTTAENIIAAYHTAYPNCKSDKVAKSNGYKLLRIATIKKAIEQGLKEKARIIEEARKKELQALAKSEILSQFEVDTVLTEIITGEWFKKNKVRVNAGDVIAAIDKYNKRFGSYAAKKFEDVTPDKVLIPGEDDN